MKEKFMNAQDEIILLQWRISVKIGIHNSAYFETVLKILLDDNFDFFQEINIEKKTLKIINAHYQMRTHRPFFSIINHGLCIYLPIFEGPKYWFKDHFL